MQLANDIVVMSLIINFLWVTLNIICKPLKQEKNTNIAFCPILMFNLPFIILLAYLILGLEFSYYTFQASNLNNINRM